MNQQRCFHQNQSCICLNGIWLAGVDVKRRQKNECIIRSKHYETVELHFDSSHLSPFEHVTCMQMIPFLVYPREGKNYLNPLMPLSGIRYNQSGEWVGKQDEGPAEIKQKPRHGCSKNKINPFIQLGAAKYSKKMKSWTAASLLIYALLWCKYPNRLDKITGHIKVCRI